MRHTCCVWDPKRAADGQYKAVVRIELPTGGAATLEVPIRIADRAARSGQAAIARAHKAIDNAARKAATAGKDWVRWARACLAAAQTAQRRWQFELAQRRA